MFRHLCAIFRELISRGLLESRMCMLFVIYCECWWAVCTGGCGFVCYVVQLWAVCVVQLWPVCTGCCGSVCYVVQLCALVHGVPRKVLRLCGGGCVTAVPRKVLRLCGGGCVTAVPRKVCLLRHLMSIPAQHANVCGLQKSGIDPV
jgi:hypothetical protein